MSYKCSAQRLWDYNSVLILNKNVCWNELFDTKKSSSAIVTTKLFTPLLLCVRDLHSLKSTLNDRFLSNVSWQFYLPAEFLHRKLVRGSRQ